MSWLKRIVGFGDVEVIGDFNRGFFGGIVVGILDWSGLRN